MRVLLNGLQAGNRSGTGRYTIELARALTRETGGLDLRVFWPAHIPMPQPSVSNLLQTVLEPVEAQGILKRLYLDQVGLRRSAVHWRADVLHYPANIGPLAAPSRVVLTIHDLAFFHNPAWHRPERALYYRCAVKHSARRATRIIADSQAAAADCREFLGLPADRIDVIPLGVSELFRPVAEERMAAVRKRYRLPESFFLFVGTLEPRKNIPRIIQAWQQIAGTCPFDLVIAGRDGWKSSPIHETADASPHRGRILFPGFIDAADLPALLGAAQVFVWPSLYEGFGLPPLEAMACGTPVVTSNTSSLPEAAGDAAITVDPCDVEAIAAAMLEAATDSTRRHTLRAKGFERAEIFTWERTAQLTIQTYRAALSQ